MIDDQGEFFGRYDKLRLLPFDEYLPWRGWMPWPSSLALDGRDAIPGEDTVRFASHAIPFAIAICWENLFGSDIRRRIEANTAFLASISRKLIVAP